MLSGTLSAATMYPSEFKSVSAPTYCYISRVFASTVTPLVKSKRRLYLILKFILQFL